MLNLALVILAIAAVFGVALLVGKLAQHLLSQTDPRVNELEDLADELGWRFRPERTRRYATRFSPFDVFQKGEYGHALHALEGTVAFELDSLQVVMGDFEFQLDEENERVGVFSYLVVIVPWTGMADLVIRPERFLDHMKTRIGLEDIAFESIEFNRRFYVMSGDRRFASDVVNPRMMQFLLDSNSLPVDMAGSSLLIADGKQRWSADEFRSRLAWVREFFEYWPKHLRVVDSTTGS